MTSLTFYGGVNEIGGNKILLEDQATRVFFDFGMSFSLANQYFDEFMQPCKCKRYLKPVELGGFPGPAYTEVVSILFLFRNLI
jgi:ribonuclease J